MPRNIKKLEKGKRRMRGKEREQIEKKREGKKEKKKSLYTRECKIMQLLWKKIW